MTLQDKIVVITGGAKGIGRYNARLFAAQGAKLAIAFVGDHRLGQPEAREDALIRGAATRRPRLNAEGG